MAINIGFKCFLITDPVYKVFNDKDELARYLENNNRKGNELVTQEPILLLEGNHLSASIVNNKVQVLPTNEYKPKDNKIP